MRTLALTFLVLFCAACSEMHTEPFTSDALSPKQEHTAPPPPEAALQSTDITLRWEVPRLTSEGYLIKIGNTPRTLTREEKIFTKDLRVEEDPRFGKVYSYRITNIPVAESLYLSITAFEGDVVSPASEVVEVR